MELVTQTWYARWFFLAVHIRGIWRQNYFVDYGWMAHTDEGFERYQDQTDLCTFVRISTHGALILGFHALVYLVLLGSVTVWPVYLFGMDSILTTAVYVIGAVAAVAWLAIVAIKMCAWCSEWRENRPVENQLPKKAGFLEAIVIPYLVAIKQKVCPLITFRHEGDVL